MSGERWPLVFWTSSFEGRLFLTEEEWKTYLRCQAVRYCERKQIAEVCFLCGKPGDTDNPLQLAHRLSFHDGVHYLGLTPDSLNEGWNLVTAHRRICNNKAELGPTDAIRLLAGRGGAGLPPFLPQIMHDLWSRTISEKEQRHP